MGTGSGCTDGVDVATLCRELDIGWSAADHAALEHELAPYLGMFEHHLASGAAIPSHIERSGCLQAAVTDVTDPYRLFQEAADAGAGVGHTRFEVRDYGEYWVTIHPSDSERQPPIPVVMMLLKRWPGPLVRLDALCARLTTAVGARVGGCIFLAWNLPRFHWDLHTDDEYEAVFSRVHLPLRTTPESLFVWARDRRAAWGDWLLAHHLERARLYHVRTDVPHTVINGHPTAARLHLILDVDGQTAF